MRATIERAFVEVLTDSDADTSYLDQDEFAERRAAYKRGEFGYVGVRACAEVRFETDEGGWIGGPVVKSPGLWGIEDDSGEDYLREVGADEAGELVELLTALGFEETRARVVCHMAPTELRYR